MSAPVVCLETPDKALRDRELMRLRRVAKLHSASLRAHRLEGPVELYTTSTVTRASVRVHRILVRTATYVPHDHGASVARARRAAAVVVMG